MNQFFTLLFILFVSPVAKENSPEFYANFSKVSLNWMFRQSAVVLSGEIASIESNSAILCNLDIYIMVWENCTVE